MTKTRNNYLNGMENVGEAVGLIFKALDEGNAYMLMMALSYLTDNASDVNHVGFSEWFTEDKAKKIWDLTCNFIETNYEALTTLKELLEETPPEEPKENPTLEEKIEYLISNFDFTDEEDCKTFLELSTKKIEEEPKPAEKSSCLRCGNYSDNWRYSRYGKIRICKTCQKDENKLALRGKALPFTEWNYIKFFRDIQQRTA